MESRVERRERGEFGFELTASNTQERKGTRAYRSFATVVMNQGDVECLAYVDVQLRQDTELKWKTKVGGPNWTFQELGGRS